MTFYIIIQHSNGSDKALAAFSSLRKAEEYLQGAESPEARIDEYEVPRGSNFSTVMMYASHKKDEAGSSKVTGYYFNIYDAEGEIGKDGFIERLAIDKKDTEQSLNNNKQAGYQSYKIEAKRERELPENPTLKQKLSEAFGDMRKLIILGILVVVIIVINVIIYSGSDFEIGENLHAVDWLPDSATKISYYKDDRFFVFEFSIDDSEFFRWVEDKNLIIEELGQKPLTITRYRFYTDIPMENFENLSEEELYLKWESMTKATITDGYSLESSDSDGSNNISGGYDSSDNRVYYISR